jgi:RNA polymerase sigma factor (sigma-70 family)
MRSVDEASTSPTLLSKVRDWRDDVAWVRFKQQYDPLLRNCCRRLNVDGPTVDEICQLTWITVAKRMESFVYDTNQSFRGWLYRVCRTTGIDYIRSHKNDCGLSFDDRDERCQVENMTGDGDEDSTSSLDDARDPVLAPWLQQVEAVQRAVKARVQPQTWEAFWLIQIRSWTVEETVAALGISHASAFKAKERVLRHLRNEGLRQFGGAPDLFA